MSWDRAPVSTPAQYIWVAKPITPGSSFAPHRAAQGRSQSAVCQADVLAGREGVTLGNECFSLDTGVGKISLRMGLL